MKQLFFFAGIISTVALSAQITITSADAMQAGERYITGNGYAVAPPFGAGTAGPSQTWNFTGGTFDYFDTLDIQAASWISPARSAPFPNCQLAVNSPNDTMYYDMVHVDATGLYVEGSSMVDPVYGILSRHYQNPFGFIKYPSSYPNVSQDTAYSDFTQPVSSGNTDSIRDILTYNTTFTVDGWGTVTTPLGTFPALRIKRDMTYTGVQYYHDINTGWGAPQTYSASDRQYEWWANGYGFPVVRLMVDMNTDSVMAFTILTSATTGIQETVQSNFQVYPNPATEFFYLDAEPQSQWELYDLNGNLVKNGVCSASKTEISVGELQKGIYFVRVTDVSGAMRSVRLCVM